MGNIASHDPFGEKWTFKSGHRTYSLFSYLPVFRMVSSNSVIEVDEIKVEETIWTPRAKKSRSNNNNNNNNKVG